MKKIIFAFITIWLLIISTNCIKEERGEKLFDTINLPYVVTSELNAFGADDSIVVIFNKPSGLFDRYDGYLAGIMHLSSEYNVIAISVFKTQQIACNAMETRINSVPAPIRAGTSGEFETKWWYSEGTGMVAVFVNQRNTIVEIHYNCDDYSAGAEIAKNVAHLIVNRVDDLAR